MSRSYLKPYRVSRLCYSVIFLAISLVSGCSSLGVQPWERDLLAKDEMALTSSPLDAALDDHIYFSKEASSGGKSFGGGGCGCN
ncbi:DUF4266 domain-containing protein [Colwellia sp. M166]|uniref:DUF4266 domain-containing protein n=1 Tax=Colwellia sp. M166 TaxID=2583805 RepID=UPI00211EE3DF|nr:DUF4266 domain-containing protein [Colwellia sp. M166]